MTLKRQFVKMRHLIVYFNMNQQYRIRLLAISCVIVVVLCCFIIYKYNSTDELTNKELNDLIENHLKMSLLYGKGTGCSVPKLPVYSQEAIQNIDFSKRPKLNCLQNGVDWVCCHKSECYVTMKELKDDLECTYTDIIYVNDDTHKLGEPVKVLGYNKYILNRSDHVKITCSATEKNFLDLPVLLHWTGYKAGLRPVQMKPTPPERKDAYNVIILVFDSTSHNGFIRFMSKSYKYLTEKMNAVVLNSHMAVGDNTITNMFPILTGKSKFEHPETRKSMIKNQYVDYKSFIFEQVKQIGYRTAYFDEHHSTFSTYNNGFRHQPADHYLNALLKEASDNNVLQHVLEIYDYCIGATPLFQLMLNLTKDFLDLDGKKLIVTHLSDISHDDFSMIVNAEYSFLLLLETIRERQMLEDSLFIVMGDHGQRYSKFRNTYQGRMEQYLPLMAIMLPERLKRLRPEALEALQHNKDVLTTHYDLHATLMDVLDLPYTNKYMVPGSELPRSISLLTKIPKSRTCDEAGIMPHFCVCAHWYMIPRTDPKFDRVVNTLTDYINRVTNVKRDKCEIRTLISVEWLMRLESRQDVQVNSKLSNQLSRRQDRYQPPDEYYQAKIIMNPNKAIFEGTMVYNVNTDRFNITDDDISRTNAYGNESICIVETHPHLKQYCHCRP